VDKTYDDVPVWNVSEVDEHGCDLAYVIFKIKAFLTKQSDTLVSCKVNRKTMYLSVTGLRAKFNIDTPLSEAGGHLTVRGLLRCLQ